MNVRRSCTPRTLIERHLRRFNSDETDRSCAILVLSASSWRSTLPIKLNKRKTSGACVWSSLITWSIEKLKMVNCIRTVISTTSWIHHWLDLTLNDVAEKLLLRDLVMWHFLPPVSECSEPIDHSWPFLLLATVSNWQGELNQDQQDLICSLQCHARKWYGTSHAANWTTVEKHFAPFQKPSVNSTIPKGIEWLDHCGCQKTWFFCRLMVPHGTSFSSTLSSLPYLAALHVYENA